MAAPEHTSARPAREPTQPWHRRGRIAVRAGIGFAAALVAYIAFVAGFGQVLVERTIERHSASLTGFELHAGRVRIRPFRGVVELTDVRLRETAGPLRIHAPRLSYAPRPASLLRRGDPQWRWLEIHRPEATVDTFRPGDAGGLPPALDALAAHITRLHVERIVVHDATLLLLREHRDPRWLFTGIDMQAHGLAPESRFEYALTIDDFEGAILAFDGTLDRHPWRVDGRVESTRLPVERVAPRLARRLAPLYSAPRVDGQARYAWRAGGRDGEAWTLEDGVGTLRADADAVAQLQYSIRTDGDTLDASVHMRDARRDYDLQTTLERTPALTRTTATGAPAALLSHVAEGAFGEALVAGTLDFTLSARHARSGAGGALEITAYGLRRGGDGELPMAFAQALLEDDETRLHWRLPVVGRTGEPLAAAVEHSLRSGLATLVARPFDALGRAVDAPGAALATLRFAPGSADPTPDIDATLALLADALGRRPGLALRIPAAYHPGSDRDALARRQVELHVRLAIAGQPARGQDTALDFTSARVQDILDEFATERLGAIRRDSIRAASPPDDEVAYHRALFDALAANERIEPITLTRLARFRARTAADALAELNVDASRIRVADGPALDNAPVIGDGIAVPLTLETHTPPEAPEE